MIYLVSQNIEERKKARTGYQAYDEEAEVAAALGLARPLLAKYDDEADPAGFRIGDDEALQKRRAFDKMVRMSPNVDSDDNVF